jgi:hypothetical protein
MLAKILEEQHGFKCTILYSGEAGGENDPQFEYNSRLESPERG